jgi:hypothetical protein
MAPEMGTMVAAPSMEAAEPKTLTLEELNYARVRAHKSDIPRLYIYTHVQLSDDLVYIPYTSGRVGDVEGN